MIGQQVVIFTKIERYFALARNRAAVLIGLRHSRTAAMKTRQRKATMRYWIIKWNAVVKGQRRSSRVFKTFLDSPDLFETYGYNSKGDVHRFAKVRKGDQVFCYQIDEGTYVAKCKVKAKESTAPGGRCLVLAKVRRLRLVEPFKRLGTLHELSENNARALCGRCGP